jgi:hypothetical protein
LASDAFFGEGCLTPQGEIMRQYREMMMQRMVATALH